MKSTPRAARPLPTRQAAGWVGACLLVAASGAALAQDAAAPAPLAARQIVMDPGTGRPRLPTPEELGEARAASVAAAAARGAAPVAPMGQMLSGLPVMQRLPATPEVRQGLGGAQVRRMDVSRLSFSVVRRGADGSVHAHCVAGEDPALHALHAPITGGRDDR